MTSIREKGVSADDTSMLIHRLSREAGQRPFPRPGTIGWLVLATVVVCYALATLEILLVIGGRPDLDVALGEPALYFKLASMFCLAVAGHVSMYRSILPGRSAPSWLVWLPALLLIAMRVATDHSGQSWLGVHPLSFIYCVVAIVLASVVPLLLLLCMMRQGAATSAVSAGARGGILIGALGAGAYAWTCQNDAGLFLLVWYPVAIAIVATMGAIAGYYLLRW